MPSPHPIETAIISEAAPFSLSGIASSTAISSKGFIFTLARATPTRPPSAGAASLGSARGGAHASWKRNRVAALSRGVRSALIGAASSA